MKKTFSFLNDKKNVVRIENVNDESPKKKSDSPSDVIKPMPIK